MEETIIEIHDYCTSYSIDVNGEDFKEYKDRKGLLKGLIDKMEDCELESVFGELIRHIHSTNEEEYENSVCEQCGNWNTYQKITLNEKI